MAAVYTTNSGDTWDMIAKKLYGSEYYADVLMAANRELIDTFTFSAGVKLTAPDVEVDEDDDGSLPPWKFTAGEEDEDEDYGDDDD